jgi:hypothetical protein
MYNRPIPVCPVAVLIEPMDLPGVLSSQPFLSGRLNTIVRLLRPGAGRQRGAVSDLR